MNISEVMKTMLLTFELCGQPSAKVTTGQITQKCVMARNMVIHVPHPPSRFIYKTKPDADASKKVLLRSHRMSCVDRRLFALGHHPCLFLFLCRVLVLVLALALALAAAPFRARAGKASRAPRLAANQRTGRCKSQSQSLSDVRCLVRIWETFFKREGPHARLTHLPFCKGDSPLRKSICR